MSRFVIRSVQSNMCPSAWQLTTHLKSAVLPFLRCAALFFHHLTSVRPPDSLLGACFLQLMTFYVWKSDNFIIRHLQMQNVK